MPPSVFLAMDIPEISQREELSDDEIAEVINSLCLGDQILFNDKKEPLKVTDLDAQGRVSIGESLSGVKVEGRQTGYILSAEEVMYHSKSGIVRRSLHWILKIE